MLIYIEFNINFSEKHNSKNSENRKKKFEREMKTV